MLHVTNVPSDTCPCVQARVYDWSLNWCGFGTVFPTGDMQLSQKRISKDQFPCEGARVVEGNKVVSNEANICCGLEDHQWKQAGQGMVSKTIDASHCCFTKKTRVTWLTSMRGTSSHWTLSGISAPIDPTNTGFKIQLVPTKGSVDEGSARSFDYRMQWCGIGERDENTCSKSPPPPPPPPSGGGGGGGEVPNKRLGTQAQAHTAHNALCKAAAVGLRRVTPTP